MIDIKPIIDNAILNQYKVQDFIPVLGDLFPLIRDLKETPQDNEWHQEGDVEIHTNMVLKEVYQIINDFKLNHRDAKVLVLSALLHDVCKPITTKEKEQEGKLRVVAPKHEIFGRSYLIFGLLNLNLKEDEILDIINLVGYHNLPKLSVIKNKSEADFKQMARMMNVELMYYLELADMRGRECSDRTQGIDNIELFKIILNDYNLFYEKPYQREIDFVKNLPNLNIQQKEFILKHFIREYENHNVFMIEETVAKLFNTIHNYSHLIILSGLAGTGKSTLAKQYEVRGYAILSLDDLRDDKNIDNKQIRSILKQQLKALLAKKENVVIDATNYRKDFRDVYAQLGFNYNAFVEIITILKPIDTILKQNKNRFKSVDDHVIYNQIKKFELAEITEAHKVSYLFL